MIEEIEKHNKKKFDTLPFGYNTQVMADLPEPLDFTASDHEVGVHLEQTLIPTEEPRMKMKMSVAATVYTGFMAIVHLLIFATMILYAPSDLQFRGKTPIVATSVALGTSFVYEFSLLAVFAYVGPEPYLARIPVNAAVIGRLQEALVMYFPWMISEMMMWFIYAYYTRVSWLAKTVWVYELYIVSSIMVAGICVCACPKNFSALSK